MLPPRDPYESMGEPPDAPVLTSPAAVYLAGPPSAESERLADRILTARPGALVVTFSG
jgi:hypothetical protein